MLATIIFAVVFVVYGVNGKPLSEENSVPLPCKFEAYDLNSNMAISFEEFLRSSEGFTKMDRRTLFELVDRNGDTFIGVDEFKHVPRSIVNAGILDHCLQHKMYKGVCIGIGWGK